MQLRNITNGPKGVNTLNFGTVELQPGEFRDDIDFADGELLASQKTGWFAFGNDALASDEKPDELAELRGQVESLTARVDELTTENGELSKANTALTDENASLTARVDELSQSKVLEPLTYEAKHKGAGSYSILASDGTEVAEKLSKEDAEAFNALSDADKVEYLNK